MLANSWALIPESKKKTRGPIHILHRLTGMGYIIQRTAQYSSSSSSLLVTFPFSMSTDNRLSWIFIIGLPLYALPDDFAYIFRCWSHNTMTDVLSHPHFDTWHPMSNALLSFFSLSSPLVISFPVLGICLAFLCLGSTFTFANEAH